MKFTCSSSNLQKAVSIVEKAIPSRTPIPILENMYLSIQDQTLFLRGNDLEIAIEYTLPINASEPGSILIKSKTLSSMLGKLQNKTLDFSKNDAFEVHISAETVNFNVSGIDVAEYPDFPKINAGLEFRLSIASLKEMIKHTLFCVSSDEKKSHLNGIFLKSESGQLTCVSTDGYRLALYQLKPESFVPDFTVIIPQKTLADFQKILQVVDFSEDVLLSVSEKQVSFRMGSIVLISRTIESKFPDYTKVIPKMPSQSVLISRRAFFDACERASIVASEANNVVSLLVGMDTVIMTSRASSMGSFYEELKLSRQMGNDVIRVVFNVHLVLDALKHMDSDDVKVSCNDGLSPCIFEPSTGSDYFYVVMPIKTNEFQEEKTEPHVYQSVESVSHAEEIME